MPTIVMTGGHAGIGRVAAQTLAQRYGCDLILTGRSRERIERTAHDLRSSTGVRVDVATLDLNSLESVRRGAARCSALLKSRPPSEQGLEAILCNAGLHSDGAIAYSADGYEQTFATNCLGHFLLVNLLLDTLVDGGRVVWTSSGTHDPATMDGKSVGAAVEPDARVLADQGRDSKPISPGRRYATSKLCIILYAFELDRRLRRAGSRISSNAYDPGFLPETGMGRMAPAIFRSAAAKLVLRKLGMTMGQMPFSGEALAMLAADDAFATVSGAYFRSNGGQLEAARSSHLSHDTGLAERLWRDSEGLTL
jgi:NAD(P)-dependent dehydrogenase (short-subunit alcohol dehydrogenase family)